MSEDVDFDFFDSPKTKTADEDERNVARSSAKDRASSRSTSTVTDDAASERTLTSAKPPTHPKSRRVRRSGGDDDGDNDADQADSPRSNASASTNQSRRTINAKIPSVANDDDDDRSDNNSDDDSSRTRSAERSSHRSGKDDHSRRSSSVASSGDRRKKDGKDTSSNRSSNLSQEERNSDSQSSKRRNKKSLYLSDDSETDQSSDVSGTDSDVTRVSPLNSPHETLKSKKSTIRAKSAGKSRAARGTPSGPDSNGTLNFNQILNAHKDTLDLKALLQTVLEMENDHSSVKNHETRSRFGAAPAGDFCRQRRNYSFNNDQVTKIDRENQRLMEIILRNAREAKKKKKEIKLAGMNPRTATRLRPTSSAINRVRLQQKIEAENLGILRRLQQTQPTRELQRDTQIKEYQRQLVFAGCAPLSSIQPRPKPYIPLFAKNAVATGDSQSDGSLRSGAGKQRPQSAFVSRPLSGKQTANASVKRRPKSAAVIKKETVKDLQLDDYVEDFDSETY